MIKRRSALRKRVRSGDKSLEPIIVAMLYKEINNAIDIYAPRKPKNPINKWATIGTDRRKIIVIKINGLYSFVFSPKETFKYARNC